MLSMPLERLERLEHLFLKTLESFFVFLLCIQETLLRIAAWPRIGFNHPAVMLVTLEHPLAISRPFDWKGRLFVGTSVFIGRIPGYFLAEYLIDNSILEIMRKKSNDYTMPAALVILLILWALGSRSPSSFKQLGSTQIQASTDRSPVDDMGPTEDGSTTLEIVNLIPYPMSFKVSAKGVGDKKIRLKSCETCKIYSGQGEIPSDLHSRGTRETIAVMPGRNFVSWSHDGGNISPMQAYWEFKQGHKYSSSVLMDLSQGRSNWDSVKQP
jgi:hypothetical protein